MSDQLSPKVINYTSALPKSKQGLDKSGSLELVNAKQHMQIEDSLILDLKSRMVNSSEFNGHDGG